MTVEINADHTTTRAWPAWACPEHGIDLEGDANVLRCALGEQYAIRDGIPRFVADEKYAAAFGAQWLRHRLTQLDSHSGLTVTRDRTKATLGDGLWEGLAGTHVLECGCGAGRFTEILLQRGANVTSVDLSAAVDANAANFPVNASHRVAQADILSLPFRRESFDLVFCLGVIQHTANSEQAIEALYAQVRPGGWLVIDHYDFAWSWYTRTAPFFRVVMRRMPSDTGLRTTEKLVDTLLPVHRAARQSRIAQTVLARLSPLNAYYFALPSLSEEHQREWALLDTHDSLTDYYKRFRSPTALRRTLERIGATNIVSHRVGALSIARAQRPPM